MKDITEKRLGAFAAGEALAKGRLSDVTSQSQYNWLVKALGRQPTARQRRAFKIGYGAWMRAAIRALERGPV